MNTGTIILIAILQSYTVVSLSDEELCLLNRVDHTPCDYRHDYTKKPNDNEYGIYSTRIRQFTPGSLTCIIRNNSHLVYDIQTNGGEPLVKYLYSPGIELQRNPEEYGNQQYVHYKVNCPANHSAFLEIIEMDLEAENCFDPNDNITKCVDYIRVAFKDDVVDFGTIETCGNNSKVFDSAQLTTSALDILFRTSDTARFRGFRAVVICVNTGLNSAANSHRKKRVSGEIDPFDQVTQDAYYICRRSFNSLLYREAKIVVQFGHSITYEYALLTINQGGRVLNYNGVVTMKVIGADGQVSFYTMNSYSRPVVLSGPGTLTIDGCVAVYKNFIVDPREIKPLTEENRAFIRTLTSSHFNNFNLESADERLCPALLDPPPFSFGEIYLPYDNENLEPDCPKPETRGESTCNWSDQHLRMALNNLQSDNPVARTLADVALHCTNRYQPERIQTLFEGENPLNVTCTKGDLLDKKYLVTCSSNRESGVTIKYCAIFCESTKTTILLETCEYPSFRLPTNLTAGPKQLIIGLVDSFGLQSNANISFDVNELDQYGHPPYCLLAHTDCQFIHKSTPQPGINEFGIYSTRIRTGSSGEPICLIHRRNSQIRAILTGQQITKYIYSPNYELSDRFNYGNNLYVVYNISCPVGHSAHLRFTRLDLEEKNCFNYHTNQFECVDYVRVNVPGKNSTEFCGSSPPGPIVIAQGNFNIVFRTNYHSRFPGFIAAILCLNEIY